jgi:hypothetical protein
MLTLRRTQKNAFATRIEEALVIRIFDTLRAWPAPEMRALDDDALRALVREGVEEGRALGITWQSSLAAFAGLRILVGPKFHEHPRVRAALAGNEQPIDARVLALGERLTKDDWREAKSRV